MRDCPYSTVLLIMTVTMLCTRFCFLLCVSVFQTPYFFSARSDSSAVLFCLQDAVKGYIAYATISVYWLAPCVFLFRKGTYPVYCLTRISWEEATHRQKTYCTTPQSISRASLCGSDSRTKASLKSSMNGVYG
ncbi:hypothetical protein BDV98DRAFT_338401 [Pterulicium gracile]|uniref:Uncharacterized protein n=1 Tax=Pterulicium gracile TaxID=1884261 RepID=A0A5C3Q4W1_9AGAR|nr:hypothetical protein BDV98DRAFT_338401 [Pterula gracilis]